MIASVSRPASTASMISAWPGRSSRRWNTSRIFSSARCSAGEGGAVGAATMVGALAVTDGGVRSVDACGSSSASAERRITIVGTPSSAAFAPADSDSADAGTVSVRRGLQGPGLRRRNSGSTPVKSGTYITLRLNRHLSLVIPSLPHANVHLLQSCKSPGGRRVRTATPTDPSSAGAGPKNPQTTSVDSHPSTHPRRCPRFLSDVVVLQPRPWHTRCRERGDGDHSGPGTGRPAARAAHRARRRAAHRR